MTLKYKNTAVCKITHEIVILPQSHSVNYTKYIAVHSVVTFYVVSKYFYLSWPRIIQKLQDNGTESPNEVIQNPN